MTSVSVVVVNWNSGSHLRACLRSLAWVRLKGVQLECVVVVDNASSDGSADQLAFAELPLKLRRNNRNLGYAVAANQGAAECHSDYLLFLNPDLRLIEDAISVPVTFLERPENHNVGILGIQLLDEVGSLQRSCARFPTAWSIIGRSLGFDRALPRVVAPHFMLEWPHHETRPVDQVMGAFFLVRRTVFDALGGFDERFFVYYDDVDFSLRAVKAGWVSVYFTGARAVHVGGGTTTSIPATRLFYNLSSRIRYARKHFGPMGLVIVIIATAVLEPLSRFGRALFRRSMQESRDVASATARLWATALGSSRGAVRRDSAIPTERPRPTPPIRLGDDIALRRHASRRA